MQTDIAKIWNDFLTGDKKAFSFLYESYFDTLYQYGMNIASDEEVVKDCIHDLFIKIYHNRDSLSIADNPKFYLLLSLKNLIFDSLLRGNRIDYMSPAEMKFYASFIYEPEDDSQEVDDELKMKFDKVMSLLSDKQREAIYLRFKHDLTYKEIMQILGISYQSVRNLIHRSILKIRENMPFSAFLLLFS